MAHLRTKLVIFGHILSELFENVLRVPIPEIDTDAIMHFIGQLCDVHSITNCRLLSLLIDIKRKINGKKIETEPKHSAELFARF